MMERFIWWHKFKKHDVGKFPSIFGTSALYICKDCKLQWEKSYL